MANISHFTQTVNGVSTTYDIHDANAVPRSGGAVMTGGLFQTIDSSLLTLGGGNNAGTGACLYLYGLNSSTKAGEVSVVARQSNGSGFVLSLKPDGTATWGSKNVAMAEDVVPRSGGYVITGTTIGRNISSSSLTLRGGDDAYNGGSIILTGKDASSSQGCIDFYPRTSATVQKNMRLTPNGTWTWNGTACQITSDQRLKQQITEIDDKLLDAWEDVNLVQFKYNDAVYSKGDKARLHTGYVVQQIDNACKSHNLDISAYGLYCHEEYPEETEEVEVEQADGTKTKERKVIREASEHYSLRYTEVYAVECMYLRRCIARLTARIEELEKGNK